MPMPTMSPVVGSSNIVSRGYDEASNMLYVEFTSGATYAYRNVPEGVWQDFQNADSAGGFFAGQIKNNFTGERQ